MKKILFKSKTVMSLVYSLLILLSCSNPGQPEQKKLPSDSNADALPGNTGIKPSDPSNSRIIMSFKTLTKYRDISAYVVGSIDAHGFAALDDKSSRYAINSLHPGTYDIIIEAQKLSDEANKSTLGVGLRISGISVRALEDTQINDVELLPYAELKGQAHLFKAVSHGAINVEIPGTRIKAKTANDGSYILEKVPAGWHEIQISNAGFIQGLIAVQHWSAEPHILPRLTLLPASEILPTGVYYRGQALSATEINQVTIFLNRPSTMNLFRWSETSDFVAAPWQTFQSSLDLQLQAGGNRKIFVQFSKDQQQLSAIYSTELTAPNPP
ncbi:MAG: hypothetical protein NTX25_12435 [Proteobacteria bacterium]|nr:hypothetical protein [Pseudomonadota bacterium]